MEKDELGLVELASRTGLLPSTAHRLLATMTHRGYVSRNPSTGGYLLSFRVLELASHAARRTTGLRAVARPHMERIRKVCGETTNLVLLQDASVVYIDQLEGSMAMRMFTEAGRTVPAHSAGAGKAILAFLDRREVRRRFAPLEPFESFTARTLTTLAALERDLARVRRRGYAVDNEEHERGVACVAAPIFTQARTPAAAISVSGPTSRLRESGVQDLGELLVSCASDLAAGLGLPDDDPVREPLAVAGGLPSEIARAE